MNVPYDVFTPNVIAVGDGKAVVPSNVSIASWTVLRLTAGVVAFLRMGNGARIRISEGLVWEADDRCSLPDQGMTLDVTTGVGAAECEIAVFYGVGGVI